MAEVSTGIWEKYGLEGLSNREMALELLRGAEESLERYEPSTETVASLAAAYGALAVLDELELLRVGLFGEKGLE